MKIEPICPEHLPGVAELEALCFSLPWSENALRLLLGPGAVGFVCTEGDRILAYGGMLLAPDEGQILNLAVHPDHRRKGLGREILNRLLAEANARHLGQVSLEVRVSNTAAVSLYRSAGFSVEGRRPHFYKQPAEDAFVMLRRAKDHLNGD